MRETLLSFLDDCRAHGEQTAVAHEAGVRVSRWSYAHLASSAFQFARELEARGICAGDRVLFWGENRPEWIACFYGCLLRGVVVVPLDLKSAPDFVARVQQQVSAKLLLSDEPQAQLNIPRLAFNNIADLLARHSDQPYSNEAKPDDLVQSFSLPARPPNRKASVSHIEISSPTSRPSKKNSRVTSAGSDSFIRCVFFACCR